MAPVIAGTGKPEIFDRFPDAILIPTRSLACGVRDALAAHRPWIVVVRSATAGELAKALGSGCDADVICLARRRLLARVLPDAVCWRRDTLAVVLASGTSIPPVFRLLRRAGRIGARIVHLISEPAGGPESFGPLWADPVHR